MILEPGLRGPALSIPEEKPEQCHIPQAISENTDRLATLGDLNFILQTKGNGEDSTESTWALAPNFLKLVSSSLLYLRFIIDNTDSCIIRCYED